MYNFFLVVVEVKESNLREERRSDRHFQPTGRYVAKRLMDHGVSIKSLTRCTGRENTFGGLLEACLLDYSNSCVLRRTMAGTGVFHNIYWIPLTCERTTFDQGMDKSRRLYKSAADVGLERIVHFSDANASPETRRSIFGRRDR